MTDAKTTAAIAELTDWKVVDGKLKRAFKFKDFVDAFGFITKVAIAAEKIGHHPELSNVYNHVVIDLVTHNMGGIGPLDIALAKKIDTF
jgi:4a-hydroxytetrahydrobiopterin dehydratase